jgi:uncharacterized protein
VTPGLVRFTKGCVQQGPIVRVEILEAPEEQQRGLMGRASLAEDEGAIFWFTDRSDRKFWMRHTIIPLDLIFIDGLNVVGILTLKALDETPLGVGRPSTSVLEVNGGFAARYGITVGQRVTVFLQ